MRHTLPAASADGDCFVVLIRTELLPIIAGVVRVLEEDRSWVTDDFEEAYNRIVEIEASMGLICAKELIESNNRLYRLINWSLNGQVYDAGGDPPSTITPAIPAVPNTDISSPGMVRTQVVIRNMLSNALNGDINADFTITPSIREQLQAIIDGLAADDTDIEGIISQLEAIALLLG